MPKIVFRKKEVFLSTGGLLVAGGGVLLSIETNPGALYGGGALSIVGAVLLLHGTFGLVTAGTRIVDEWRADLLHRCLENARPDSTIHVLQTSIPDVTRLIGHLEDLLLNRGKQFRLRILLLDYEQAPALVAARVQLRVESAEGHMGEIRTDIDQLVHLKRRVDDGWRESRSGAKLDLQIRLYSFLPFGSVIRIGDTHIFSGLYWNWTSSINGPMLVITDSDCNMWKCCARHLAAGWNGGRAVFPPSDNGGTASNASPVVAQQPDTGKQHSRRRR